MFNSMSFGIIINIVFSCVFIYGIHSFWNYLKDNYSTKKTKDLVNTQIQKYKKMMETIQNQSPTNSKLFENEIEKKAMNDDLLDFLNQQTMKSD